MEESLVQQLTTLTEQQQLYITWALIIFGHIGKWLGAASNGGGLKKIITRIWLGNTVDQVIAKDYPELATKPTKNET